MCDFLGVCNTTSNTSKIKEAIAALESKGDIKVLQEGYTWTLTLSVKAERKEKIKKIKNAYIKAIQNYNPEDKDKSVAWENILKVLVFLCADKREIKRYDEIAKALGMTEKTVKRAVNALVNIEFNDLSVKKKLAWFKVNNDFKVVGNKYEVGYSFE
jgi:Fic family protein